MMSRPDTHSVPEIDHALAIEFVSPLTPAAVQLVKELAQRVLEESVSDSSVEREKYVFRFVLSANKVVDAAFRNFPKTSFLHLARLSGRLVGFSIMSVTEDNEVVDSFVGVDWLHQRRGLATQLKRAAHDELRRRGVSQYVVDVTENSRGLFEKEQATGALGLQSRPGEPHSLLVTLR